MSAERTRVVHKQYMFVVSTPSEDIADVGPTCGRLRGRQRTTDNVERWHERRNVELDAAFHW